MKEDIAEMWYLCKVCIRPLVEVKRRWKPIEKICPYCTEMNPNHYKLNLDGVYCEVSPVKKFKFWFKDKPLRWIKRVVFRRY